MASNNDVSQGVPFADLVLMPLKGTEDFVAEVDKAIIQRRKEVVIPKNEESFYKDYLKTSYIQKPGLIRFGTGEGKCELNSTIRGVDLYIIADITNSSVEYKASGHINHMSPDDHFQDLKRVIAATNGKTKRINVIMPFLYESRQHKRTKRESLDCALALQELVYMGVSNIITFDASDPRVMNAIPLASFDSINCYYQFIKTLLGSFNDIKIDSDNLMMISPDEGAMHRAIYYANLLGIDVGMFYKRRDYSRIVDGRNPIVAHEFLGRHVEGKDVVIVDDMISSGDSLIDTARELKERKAKRVFAICTFGLFTSGLDKFDKAHSDGILEAVLTTNCIYQNKDLFDRKWYRSVDVSDYLAAIIDALNHDGSISSYLDPADKIHEFVDQYNKGK